MPPTLANGKICYLEIPAIDVRCSVEFYQAVFGWKVRRRGDGSTAFDDAVGEVSGTWVTGGRRLPTRSAALRHGRQCCRSHRRGPRARGRARAADRHGCARGDRQVSRPCRKRHRPLPGTQRLRINWLATWLTASSWHDDAAHVRGGVHLILAADSPSSHSRR